jgi:serine protease AprX
MIRFQWKILLSIAILTAFASTGGYAESRKVWVFFRDKGGQSLPKTAAWERAARLGISEEALRNRAKVRSRERLVDSSDLPLESSYVAALKRAGFEIKSRSRWLNAVTVLADENRIRDLSALPFVLKVRPVVSYSRVIPEGESGRPGQLERRASGGYDYGASETQVSLMHVPEAHELGLTGRGVRIGMLDAGFDTEGRRVFGKIDLIRRRSFIDQGLLGAAARNDKSSQKNHGTETLSVIGGFDEGNLVGPAFNASFALAETEWVSSETRVEEDWWVSGIEWLVDSVGVDVVSSSLAYNTFDDGTGYAYADMDGRTCATTVAANMAADRGVVVCNSAGNEAGSKWRGVLSPADGESVLAVGAVSLEGTHAGFSSGGPTADGRIKPDISAMGVGVVVVNPDREDDSEYLFASGTSFSCPLIAGVCALVAEAHPDLTAGEIREAVRNTSSRSEDPDTLIGWGIANALEAVFYHGMIFRNFSAVQYTNENRIGFQFEVLSRTGFLEDSVQIEYEAGGSGISRMSAARIQNPLKHVYEVRFPPQIDYRNVMFSITARDSSGRVHTSPRHAPEQLHRLSDWFVPPSDGPDSSAAVFILRPNYPNPFRGSTWFELEMLRESGVKIEIFDCIGRKIDDIHLKPLQKGKVRLEWNARDRSGVMAPAGLYVVRVIAGAQTQHIKIINIK